MGSKTDTPAAYPPGALIVTEARAVSDIAGFSRLEYKPFEIVPVPTPGESQLLANAGEDLRAWWGGPLDSPPRGDDGLLYPVLAVRPIDGKLWLRVDPYRLIPLASAERQAACFAIDRCHDESVLRRVPDSTSDKLVRAAAQHALATIGRNRLGDLPRKLGFALEEGDVVVHMSDGESRAVMSFYADDLREQLEQCEDLGLLEKLADSPYRPLATAARNRLSKLAPPEPEQAPEFNASRPHELTAGEDGPVIVQGEWEYPLGAAKLDELKPLLAACEDPELLAAIVTTESDDRKTLHELAEKRLKELAKAAEETAAEAAATGEQKPEAEA